MKLTPGAMLAVAILTLAAAGCAPDTGAPGADAAGTDAQAGDLAPSVAGGGSAAARLPDNFPADFPLPPDLEITQGAFTEGDAMTQANFLVRGTSSMSVAEVANFYHELLPEAGFEVQRGQPVSPDATQALVYFQGEEFEDSSIQLSGGGGTTNVLISLPLRSP